VSTLSTGGENAKAFITICAAIALVGSIAAATAAAYDTGKSFYEQVQGIDEVMQKQVENTADIAVVKEDVIELKEGQKQMAYSLKEMMEYLRQVLPPPPLD